MSNLRFLLVGDESRQIYLYKKLKAKGYLVDYAVTDNSGIREYGSMANKKKQYDVVLLPVPSSRLHFENICNMLSGNEYVFGCNLNTLQSQFKVCEADDSDDSIAGNEFHFVEYMKSDEVAYKNAVATAEGSIAEAIIRSKINLHASSSLIAGFGRCAQVLAAKLKGLDSRVTVLERKSEKRAKAEALGYMTMDFCEKNYREFKKFQFVFNTVPALIFDDNILRYFDKNVVIIDIASKPGGIDYKYCKEVGITAVNALGLPGKYAPEASADILYDVICEKLKLER